MNIRKTCAILALSSATLCQACGTDLYKPAEIPPAPETVTVYRDLPDGLLKACDKPYWDPAEILTDVDLMGLTAQMSSALDRCADQVDGIREVYRKAGPPPPAAGGIDGQ